MRPTVDYLITRFSYYNRLCFGGSLPFVAIKISNTRMVLGTFTHPRKTVGDRRKYLSNCAITLSCRFDMDASVVDDTLVHEMIHYFLWINRKEDDTPHGPNFKAMMKHINSCYGRSITVSHRTTDDEISSDSRPRLNIICLTTFQDGKLGVTNCATTCIFEINRAFSSAASITEIKWYVSSDQWFNRFPRSRKPKIYNISSQQLTEHLSQARQYIIEDDKFKIMR